MSEELQCFRRALRQEHDLLEASPPFCHLAKGEPSLAEYGDFLRVMHRFYAAVEEPLKSFIDAGKLGFVHAYVPRLPALAADLAVLSFAPLPSARIALPLNDAASVFGCLYVLEGSSHGARLLRVRLRETLGEDQRAFSFLDLLAQQPGSAESWDALLRELGRRLALKDEYARILDGAVATFSCLRQLAAMPA